MCGASVSAMPTRAIQAELRRAGVSTDHVYERSALVELLLRLRRSEALRAQKRRTLSFDRALPDEAPALRAFQRLALWALRLRERELIARLIRVGAEGYDPLASRQELALVLARTLLAPTPAVIDCVQDAATFDWPAVVPKRPRALRSSTWRVVDAYIGHCLGALRTPAAVVFSELVVLGDDPDERREEALHALVLAERRLCREGAHRDEADAADASLDADVAGVPAEDWIPSPTAVPVPARGADLPTSRLWEEVGHTEPLGWQDLEGVGRFLASAILGIVRALVTVVRGPYVTCSAVSLARLAKAAAGWVGAGRVSPAVVLGVASVLCLIAGPVRTVSAFICARLALSAAAQARGSRWERPERSEDPWWGNSPPPSATSL